MKSNIYLRKILHLFFLVYFWSWFACTLIDSDINTIIAWSDLVKEIANKKLLKLIIHEYVFFFFFESSNINWYWCHFRRLFFHNYYFIVLNKCEFFFAFAFGKFMFCWINVNLIFNFHFYAMAWSIKRYIHICFQVFIYLTKSWLCAKWLKYFWTLSNGQCEIKWAKCQPDLMRERWNRWPCLCHSLILYIYFINFCKQTTVSMQKSFSNEISEGKSKNMQTIWLFFMGELIIIVGICFCYGVNRIES